MSSKNGCAPRRPSTPPLQQQAVLPIPERLTKPEIEQLRQHGKEVSAYARKAFKDWNPTRQSK